VWRDPTAYGAEEGELRVKILRDRGAVVVHDMVDGCGHPGSTTCSSPS